MASSSSSTSKNTVDYNLGRVIANRYMISEKLGAGAFGVIYLGHDMVTGQKLAFKIEPKSLKHPQLECEAKVYQLLSGSPNVPNVHYLGSGKDDKVLVMDLCGPSLEDLFTYCGRKFSLKTVVLLGDQMIQRIEYLHYKHFIHRDIKPDNFVVGLDDLANKVFLIDFGLAKRYRRPGSLVHIPFRDKKNLTGTARYASINTHKGCEQSRRDDLESLGYVLVYFLLGQLPWQGLKAVNKNDKYGRIFEKKLGTSPEQLCRGLPDEFIQYFKHVRNLGFEERPDYDYLKRLFRNVMQREQFKRDYIFDWSLCRLQHEKSIAEGHPPPNPTTGANISSPWFDFLKGGNRQPPMQVPPSSTVISQGFVTANQGGFSGSYQNIQGISGGPSSGPSRETRQPLYRSIAINPNRQSGQPSASLLSHPAPISAGGLPTFPHDINNNNNPQNNNSSNNPNNFNNVEVAQGGAESTKTDAGTPYLPSDPIQELYGFPLLLHYYLEDNNVTVACRRFLESRV